MSVIAPAVLAENADQYKQTIDKIQPFANRIHVDVSDGEFAPTFTVGFNELWWPEGWEVDIHAMVARPAEHLQMLVQLKPSMVIFHAEADTEQLPSVLATLKQYNIKAGISLLRPTVPSSVTNLIQQADHVMVFTGDLGKYGGTANLMQLEKVRLIKQINPEAEIGWDGGVNLDNAYTLTQGGVNVLNVGGAIQKAMDAETAYKQLVDEINKQGVL
jgi:ribulose-phosphate 3-epimerase